MSDCRLCDAGVPVKTVAFVPFMEQEQFRFPRSKKTRIRKKWAKDPRNWRTKHEVKQMVVPQHIIEFIKKAAQMPIPVSYDAETLIIEAHRHGDQIAFRRL